MLGIQVQKAPVLSSTRGCVPLKSWQQCFPGFSVSRYSTFEFSMWFGSLGKLETTYSPSQVTWVLRLKKWIGMELLLLVMWIRNMPIIMDCQDQILKLVGQEVQLVVYSWTRQIHGQRKFKNCSCGCYFNWTGLFMAKCFTSSDGIWILRDGFNLVVWILTATEKEKNYLLPVNLSRPSLPLILSWAKSFPNILIYIES